MTYLAKDIRDHLVGSTAIQNAFSTRIYPGVIPQEERNSGGSRRELYPCIVYTEVTGRPENYLGGESGVHQTRIQLDIYTDGTGGQQRLNELTELVRNRLSGYRGTFGTGCYGTAHLERNEPLTMTPQDGSDKHRRRQVMEFLITHTAAVPTLT